jgi:hypothetical protein
LFFKQSIDNLRIIQRNKCRNKGWINGWSFLSTIL